MTMIYMIIRILFIITRAILRQGAHWQHLTQKQCELGLPIIPPAHGNHDSKEKIKRHKIIISMPIIIKAVTDYL